MNKLLLTLSVTLLTSASFAQDVSLPDYNWSTTDVAAKGLTKEGLFKSMNRDLIKVGQSICSNRALMWVHDFKRKHDLDASKIFLFYTGKTGRAGAKTWWYHVSPIVVEKGVEYVMDAGFPGHITSPLTVGDWVTTFIGNNNCKEIRANETELIEKMFSGAVFPETTKYGKFDCYYKKVPAGYWTPASVAMNLLGENESGQPVTHDRPAIDMDEVYAACTEAVTSPVGRILGSGKKKCKKYLGL